MKEYNFGTCKINEDKMFISYKQNLIMYESPSDMICQLKRLTCELGLNDEVDIRID